MINMKDVDNIRKAQEMSVSLANSILSKRQIVKKISRELKIDTETIRTYLEIDLIKLLDTSSRL